MSNNLVAAFNALQQSPTIDSQRVPNDWHFDLRFIRRTPISSLCLLILQPHSRFTHIASLPFRDDNSSYVPTTGLEFFPDTPQEAAPEIVKVLLHFFVNFPRIGNAGHSTTLAPWQLTTWNEALAHAVNAELKQQGVQPSRVCSVGIASAQVNAVADAQLQESLEDTWEGDDVIRPLEEDVPKSVSLLNAAPNPFIPGDYQDLEGPERYARMAQHYGAMLARGTPSDGGPYYGLPSLVKERRCLSDIQQLLMTEPGDVVKSAADHGDANAALDYGIRLSLGLECEPSRKLSRVYLMKAADSETATDKTKVTAHGLLVFWYCDASITETVPIHFIYAACQHANLAALFCERVSPHDFSSSPAVIWLLDSVIGVNPAEDLPQDMPFMYPEMFEVDDERQERTCELDEVFLQKKRNHSHEYFCDADDCDIQTEFPDTLFKCDGTCDEDKKPRYCSDQCQKAAWPGHKPRCRPGAPSDLKICWPKCIAYGDRQIPSLRIPIHRGPDLLAVLNSYTLTASQLKALKPFSDNPSRFKFPKIP